MGTMQVGMIGTDGIVLASDTLWSTQGKFRQTTNVSKMRISHRRGLAISCARSMETSPVIAEKLISDLSEADVTAASGKDFCSAVESIAQSVIERRSPDMRNEIQCLVVSLQPSFRLFRLRKGPIFEGVAGMVCEEIISKAFTGDDQNAAIFWAERYYERRPVKELVFLAAQLVTAAARLNSGAIGGLEVVLCDASGIHQLDQKSNRELEAKAVDFGEELRASFASYSQQFTYVPNVVG